MEGKKLSWLQRRAAKLLGEDRIVDIAVKAIDRDGLAARINRSILQYVMPGNVIQKIDDKAEQYIKHGFYGNSDLFSVVSWIAGKAAEIPWKLYEVNKDGEKEEILSHEALDVWRRPNDRQGGQEFREELFQFHLITGNGFIYGEAPEGGVNKGKWKELHNMPAQNVEIVSGGWKQPIKGYKLQGDYNKVNEIEAESVLHLKTPNLEYENGNYLYGASPVRAVVMAVTSSNDAYATKAYKFQNRGADGVLGIEDAEDEDMDRLNSKILKQITKYKGPQDAGKFAAITKKANWTQIGQSLVELAILDSINADLRAICRPFKIDSKVLNDPSASTYNNVSEARTAAYTDAIIPMLMKLKDEVNRWYTPRFGDNLIMEPDFSKVPELQEEFKELYERLNNPAAWIIPPNVKLRMMGLDEVDDPRFDVPWAPFGVAPITEMGNIPDDELEEELKKLGITSEYKKRSNGHHA